MRRSSLRVTLGTALGFCSTGVVGMDFLNPPPFGQVGDFSDNPIYPLGSKINVVWTPPDPADHPTSIALFQLNGTEFLQPFEYLTHNVVNVTSYPWIVATQKNLTFSNLFYLSVFREGETTADANSHYFNITDDSNDQEDTTSAAPTSSADTAATLSPAESSTPTGSVPSEPAAGGLSTGAKVGIGIGVPAAVILGVVAGWFFFKRKLQKQMHQQQQMSMGPGGYPNSMYGGTSVGTPSMMAAMGQTPSPVNGQDKYGSYYAPVNQTAPAEVSANQLAVHELAGNHYLPQPQQHSPHQQ